MPDQVASLSVGLYGDDKTLSRSLRNAEGAITNTGRVFGKVTDGIAQGLGIGVGLGVAGLSMEIAGLGKDVVGLGISWESAFAGVRKTVDGTEADLARIEQGLLALSVSDSPVAGLDNAALELAKIAEIAGQLGIEKENIVAFSETIAMLGMTTNIVGEEGALQLAQFANITQMAQGDIDKLGSVIVALGNNLATTERDIVNMSQRLGAAGNLAGFTEDQILALSGAMSSVGIQAEAGGSAMSRVLQDISTAVGKGGEDVKAFARVAGKAGDDFSKIWKDDPVEALQLFIKGLSEMDEASKLLTLDELELDGIRVSDTLLRLAGNTELVAEAFDIAGVAWDENTALMTEAEQRFDTTEAQLNALENKFKTFGAVIGSETLPYVNDFVDGLGNLASAGASLLGIDFDLSPETTGVDFQAAAAGIVDSVLGADRTVSTTMTIEVKPGMTISEISAQTGLPIEEVMEQVGIDNPRLLQPGVYEFDIGAEANIGVSVAQFREIDGQLSGVNTGLQETEQSVSAFEKTLNDLDIDSENLLLAGGALLGLASPYIASGLAATAVGMGAFALAALPFVGAAGLVAALATDFGGISTQFKEAGEDIHDGDLAGALWNLGEALLSIPYGAAEELGDSLFGIDVEEGLAAWKEIPGMIAIIGNELIGAKVRAEEFHSALRGFGETAADAAIAGGGAESFSTYLDSLGNAGRDAATGRIDIPINFDFSAGLTGLQEQVATLEGEDALQIPYTVQAGEETFTTLREALGAWREGELTNEELNAMQIYQAPENQERMAQLATFFDANVRQKVEQPFTASMDQKSVNAAAAQIDKLVEERTVTIKVNVESGGGGGTMGPQPEARAAGGPVSAGDLYLVGEAGPELFVPGRSGQIVPNNALRGGSGGININGDIHISGVQDIEGLYDALLRVGRMRA